MHIPDGFVSGPINLSCAALSIAALAYSLRRVEASQADKPFALPLAASMAAFVFAAQMLNFPIGGGTSGHFLGAVTVAALLGPFSACTVLACVLVIQGLLFGDGGLSALGTNIFNMGVIAGLAAYPLMRGLRALLPAGRNGYFAAAAIASWASIVAASSACAIELALSGTSPLAVTLPAMAGTHAIIGLGEAVICIAVLNAVATARPDLLPAWAALTPDARARETLSARHAALACLAAALLLAAFASPFASSAPDGLEKIAQTLGFLEAAAPDKTWWNAAPLADYSLGASWHGGLSTALAGVIGALAAFSAGYVLLRALRRQGVR